jgi:hypothetical protein
MHDEPKNMRACFHHPARDIKFLMAFQPFEITAANVQVIAAFAADDRMCERLSK